MARKDSAVFYLRKKVTSSGTSFVEESIDLSSFVDLPKGKCLRVRQCWFQWSTDNYGPILGVDVSASGPAGASIGGQITTTTRTGFSSLAGKETIALNNLYAYVDTNETIEFIAQDSGLNPVDFDDGYIVATDAIYFGVKGSTDTFAAALNMSVLMEVEVVTLNKDDAISLATSQL